jgi:tetracycline repressor-like protein
MDRSARSLRGDLPTVLRAWIRVNKGTVKGRAVVRLIAEVQRDPESAEIWREGVVGPTPAHHRTIVERAIGRGEVPVPPDVDSDVTLDLIFGAAYTGCSSRTCR